MASSEKLPRASSTLGSFPHVDITYKLAYECVKGNAPRSISDPNDYIHIKTDPNSYLNRRLSASSQMIICSAHFVWANYSGDLSGVYDKAEDTLFNAKLLKNTLRNDAGTGRAVSNVTITLFKERTQSGTLVDNGGRYVRLDVDFAGSAGHSAKIWGKRVTGHDTLGAHQLSRDEKLRLGIEGKRWRWQSD